MDPICGTVGLVAGAASIISVVGKSIVTLTNLRQKYKEAEWNITLLTGHLQLIRTALCRVQNWAECLSDESCHYLLIMDLDQSVEHCRILIEHIDDQISRLEWDDGLLKFGSKALFLFEDKATSELLTLLDRQMNALTLCLVASQFPTPKAQQQFLGREETQLAFDRVRDDTSSLIGFRDSSSFLTARSRGSVTSHFSRVFDFDGVLLRHKTYQDTFRNMLRRAASPAEKQPYPQPKARSFSDTPVVQLQSMARTTARIDSELKQDGRRLNKQIKILAIGDKHGRSAIIKQMRSQYGDPYTEAEVEQYRQNITSLTIKALVAIMDYVEDSGNGLVRPLSRQHAQAVRDYAASAAPDWVVDDAIACSVKYIWATWHVQQAYSIMEKHGETAYCLDLIGKICQPGYVPSSMDIIRAPEPIETLKETELRMTPSSQLKVIEFQEQQAMKILPQFAGVQCCLFTIDLTCYDRYLNNAAGTNALRDRISRLQDILLSPHFSETLMMLVFTNRTAFAQHIIKSPLKSHFPDYEGGNNVAAAAKYILKSCRRANRKDRALVWHTFLEDASEVESTADFFRQSTLCRQVFMTYS